MSNTLQVYGLPVLYGLLVCLVGLNLRNDILWESNSENEIACRIALSFVIMTVPISAYQLIQNLTNFVEPPLQAHIVRIIWLVPVYSVQSWLSIQFYQYSVLCQAIRESYESYVLYCFFKLLIEYFGSEKRLLDSLHSNCGRHMTPCCCLPSWKSDSNFIPLCKLGIFQYVVLRFVTAVITLFVWAISLPVSVSAYVNMSTTVINVLSQSWALYVLLLFYYATFKELAEFNPLGKFLCIKSVVFFSWWQSVLIGLLVWWYESVDVNDFGQTTSLMPANLSRQWYRHLQTDNGTTSVHQISDNIQDLLICTEMLVAAMAFLYAFPISEINAIHDRSTSKALAVKSQMTNEDMIEPSAVAVIPSVNIGCSCHCFAGSGNHETKDSIQDISNSSKIDISRAIIIVICFQTDLLRDMSVAFRTVLQYYCCCKEDYSSSCASPATLKRHSKKEKPSD